MEGDLTWDGDHSIQCKDAVFWNCAPETSIISLTSVTPINSIKRRRKKNIPESTFCDLEQYTHLHWTCERVELKWTVHLKIRKDIPLERAVLWASSPPYGDGGKRGSFLFLSSLSGRGFKVSLGTWAIQQASFWLRSAKSQNKACGWSNLLRDQWKKSSYTFWLH